ncbi:MAG: head GIN domain-containing protein [Candidatus Krumholzibacteriia bacterium]
MARKLTLLLMILTLAAAASAHRFDRGTKGNGDLTTRTYDLDDCHAIELECGLDIAITFGNKQQVSLTMDENLVEQYEFEVHGGTLNVAADKNPRPSRGARLELTLRKLDHVLIGGAGDITIDKFDGDELTLVINGAGDIEADGKVERLVVEVGGAGDVDLRELAAEHAEVTVNGAGDVKVNASKSCDVTINGVGDVDVYGKPEEFHKSVNGIGDVDRK